MVTGGGCAKELTAGTATSAVARDFEVAGAAVFFERLAAAAFPPRGAPRPRRPPRAARVLAEGGSSSASSASSCSTSGSDGSGSTPSLGDLCTAGPASSSSPEDGMKSGVFGTARDLPFALERGAGDCSASSPSAAALLLRGRGFGRGGGDGSRSSSSSS